MSADACAIPQLIYYDIPEPWRRTSRNETSRTWGFLRTENRTHKQEEKSLFNRVNTLSDSVPPIDVHGTRMHICAVPISRNNTESTLPTKRAYMKVGINDNRESIIQTYLERGAKGVKYLFNRTSPTLVSSTPIITAVDWRKSTGAFSWWGGGLNWSNIEGRTRPKIMIGNTHHWQDVVVRCTGNGNWGIFVGAWMAYPAASILVFVESGLFSLLSSQY